EHSIATILRWTAGHESTVAGRRRAPRGRDGAAVGTALPARAGGPAPGARRHAPSRSIGGCDRGRGGAQARRARARDPGFADGGATGAPRDRSAPGASPAKGAATDPAVGGVARGRPDRA